MLENRAYIRFNHFFIVLLVDVNNTSSSRVSHAIYRFLHTRERRNLFGLAARLQRRGRRC